MGRHVGLLAVILLAACSSDTERGPVGPPNYREGYAHGCESILFKSGVPKSVFNKDEESYAAEDPWYRRGWDDGYGECKPE